MNNKQKILISTSFLFLGISALLRNFPKNSQSNKGNFSLKINNVVIDKNKQNKRSKTSFFKIIFLFLFLIILGIVIYRYYRSDKLTNKIHPEGNHHHHQNHHQKINNKHQTSPKNDENKYQKWQCGMRINGNFLEVFLCPKWDSENFFNQLWQLDVENKNDYPDLYKDLRKKYQQEIKNFFDLCIYVLKIINVSIFPIVRNETNQNSVTYIFTIMAKKFYSTLQSNSNPTEIVLDRIIIDNFYNNQNIINNNFNNNLNSQNFSFNPSPQNSLIYFKRAIARNLLFSPAKEKINQPLSLFKHFACFVKKIIKLKAFPPSFKYNKEEEIKNTEGINEFIGFQYLFLGEK